MDDRAGRVFCDWGGTRLRAWMEVAGNLVERHEGPGIGMLRGRPAAQVLLAALAPWRQQRRLDGVFLCGMAGSRDGVIEVPYAPAPVTADAWARAQRRLAVDDLAVTVAAGVRARNFWRADDVMRGEETQVFGALALTAHLLAGRHLVLLPGTHSKWVELESGRILRLQTYLTGELFALLCESSSLLRAAGGGGEAGDGFAAGLERASQCDVAAGLFETRSAQLTAGRSGGWARAFLSGLLIGGETRGMLRSGATVRGGPVTIIGDADLASLYQRALAAGGVEEIEILDGEACALAGLRKLAATNAGECR